MRKIVFVRHGKALAAGEDGRDINRVLGEKGIAQAVSRKKQMGDIVFDLVLSSPAPRAHKTAAIVTGKPKNHIVVVEALYPQPDDGGIGTAIDKLFNRPHLGYAPVSKYEAEPNGEGDVLMDWAYDAYTMCDIAIGRAGKNETVGIFGHAVCLPATGMAFCDGYPKLVDVIKEINLKECEGFVINFDDAGHPVSVDMIVDEPVAA